MTDIRAAAACVDVLAYHNGLRIYSTTALEQVVDDINKGYARSLTFRLLRIGDTTDRDEALPYTFRYDSELWPDYYSLAIVGESSPTGHRPLLGVLFWGKDRDKLHLVR